LFQPIHDNRCPEMAGVLRHIQGSRPVRPTITASPPLSPPPVRISVSASIGENAADLSLLRTKCVADLVELFGNFGHYGL
jgi:hypothetical protein